MKKQLFDELLLSVRQMGQIRRGEVRPSRVFSYRAIDIAAIRDRIGKSQSEFARMIGVSTATLQNWEQGRRTPRGPAMALLRVADANPKAVARALTLRARRGAA